MEEELGAEQAGGAGTPEETGQWFDSFAEDIRTNQNVTKFGSAEELAKSYINAQNLIGRDKIPMPVTDEDWANTYSRLGRPDEAAGYEIQAPEGVEIDTAQQEAFLNLAHELGLSQKQAQALASYDFDRMSNAAENSSQNAVQAQEEAISSLKNEWGNAFDQNVTVANRALTEFASEQDIQALQETEVNGLSLADHPVVVKLLANVGKGMMDSGKLEGKGSDMAMTPAEIGAKQSQLMGHPAYLNKNHPEHNSIKSQVQKLFELQFPE